FATALYLEASEPCVAPTPGSERTRDDPDSSCALAKNPGRRSTSEPGVGAWKHLAIGARRRRRCVAGRTGIMSHTYRPTQTKQSPACSCGAPRCMQRNEEAIQQSVRHRRRRPRNIDATKTTAIPPGSGTALDAKPIIRAAVAA